MAALNIAHDKAHRMYLLCTIGIAMHESYESRRAARYKTVVCIFKDAYKQPRKTYLST